MGNTSVIELGPKTDTGSSYAFDVGPKLLTMLVIPNESHSKASQVSMTWGDESAPQMSFDPTTHENSTSCNIFQDSEEVAVTYSQCSFVCGPMAISESGKTSQAIPQQPSKGKPKRSVAHPSPLPAEKDGVLSNGTAFNPNPNNNANATRSPQSCWTTPAKPALHTKKGDFSSGQCQICVTRWDTGEDPKYQLWIRDAHNHAMGEMKTTPLPRSDLEPYDSTNLTTPAGNKFVSLWEMEFDGFFGQPDITGVYMTWQANLEVLQATMTFSPSSVGSPTENCSFSGSTKGGTVTNFQCHFEC